MISTKGLKRSKRLRRSKIQENDHMISAQELQRSKRSKRLRRSKIQVDDHMISTRGYRGCRGQRN